MLRALLSRQIRAMERSFDYIEFSALLKWSPKREEGIRVGAGPSLGVVTGARDRYHTVTPAGISRQVCCSVSAAL